MTTTTTETLYVNTNGEVACQRHGGQYLADAVAAHPNRVTHATPLDSWMAIPADLAAEDNLACETCSR